MKAFDAKGIIKRSQHNVRDPFEKGVLHTPWDAKNRKYGKNLVEYDNLYALCRDKTG